jgi:hypothetical protein
MAFFLDLLNQVRQPVRDPTQDKESGPGLVTFENTQEAGGIRGDSQVEFVPIFLPDDSAHIVDTKPILQVYGQGILHVDLGTGVSSICGAGFLSLGLYFLSQRAEGSISRARNSGQRVLGLTGRAGPDYPRPKKIYPTQRPNLQI